jgi:single-strand selective monofunctional uracil DNA glycosylase
VDALEFPSVPFVYNPLEYARVPHEAYLERWGSNAPREVLMLGINPGPFGMAQTGVPFGDVAMVRDFLGIEAPVGKPPHEHPKRPIAGFECGRSEVSGTRLWGWAQSRFGTAERFFERFFVANWCPLVFMEASGRNVTPDKLSPAERKELFEACDTALAKIVDTMQPRLVVGVGRFAERRAHAVLGEAVPIGCIPHPSPASPGANRGWADAVDAQLRELGFLTT